MTTANQAMLKARSYLGYTERGNNITQFWARQYPALQGAPWCAAFVIDVLDQCGNQLLKQVPSRFYTPSMEAWAKKNGRWINSKNAKPGDVVIFGGSGAVHTGFFERQYSPTHIVSIEGNTSAGNGGSQTNGGGVYRRVRPRSWIRGVISMQDQYTGSNVLVTAGSGTQKAPRLDEDGELGPKTLAALERYLGRPQDGTFDRMLVRALQQWVGRERTGKLSKEDVKSLQRKVSAVVDGEWGPNTTFGLQRYLNRRNGYVVT